MGLSRSLSRVQHTNPGLARSPDKAQIVVRAPQADRQCVEWLVSKDGGSTARRRPNLSITSPYESIIYSTCRQPLKADCHFCTGRFHTVPPSFARFQNTSRLESDCFHIPNLFTKPSFPLSFARLETRARLSRRNRQNSSPFASLPPSSHTLSPGHTPQPTGRGLSRDGVGIRGISQSSTTAQTIKQQPLTPPDTHITPILPTTYLYMHLMGDLS